MIVAMKKVSVIVQSKDAQSAINRLRSLGVLHVEHQQAPKGDDISRAQEGIALFERALNILSEPEFTEKIASLSNETSGDCKAAARHIVDLRKRLEQLKEFSISLKNGINQWESWGDFNPDTIKELGEKGIYVRLYRIPAKEISGLPSAVIAKKFFTAAGIANCAVISQEKISIPYKEIELPKMGLEKMRARLSDDLKTMHSIGEEIRRHQKYRRVFLDAKSNLDKETEFYKALGGMGASQNLMYVAGYVPYDAAEKLLGASKQEKWGIVLNDPAEDDNVPTLIRNPRWVSIIRPVFKIIEIIPGYREFDISLLFLIFLSVFFGMLIGDAGYGLIYFFLTFLAQRKWAKRVGAKSPFILLYLLSSCAIVWGAFSGTFFGQGWLIKAGVRPIFPALTDDKNVRSLCFFIGALHLSIAHIWRIIIQFPSLVFLTDVGWILILWCAFFLAKSLILGAALPWFLAYMLVPGMALVVLFSNPRRNIARGVGAGLGTLALNLMNNFTDVVSYIRLFAVGLAGVALADAFNTMASGIGIGGILGAVIRSLILIAGHSLNIMLGPMSVLVHGIRLNVLEFCTHLDVKWSGFAYKPLGEQSA